MMIVVKGSAMENSVRLVVTFGGPPQWLTSFGGDDTNTRGPKADKFLGALEGQDQAEATTGVPRVEALVGTLEGWEGAPPWMETETAGKTTGKSHGVRKRPLDAMRWQRSHTPDT